MNLGFGSYSGFGTTPQKRCLEPLAKSPKLSIHSVPAPFRSFFTQDSGHPNALDFQVNVFSPQSIAALLLRLRFDVKKIFRSFKEFFRVPGKNIGVTAGQRGEQFLSPVTFVEGLCA